MSGENERARAEHLAQLELAEQAAVAMSNPALTAYFDEVERRSVEALLACEEPAELDRLRVAAVTVRKVRQFLREAQPAGEFAAAMLERINKEEAAR